MARTPGSIGINKLEFETGWYEYCEQNPDFKPGYIAAKMVHEFAKKGDSRQFMGGLVIAERFLSKAGDSADGGAQLALVIDRTQEPAELEQHSDTAADG